MDVIRECLLYADSMNRVYKADANTEERSGLRLLPVDMKMEGSGLQTILEIQPMNKVLFQGSWK